MNEDKTSTLSYPFIFMRVYSALQLPNCVLTISDFLALVVHLPIQLITVQYIKMINYTVITFILHTIKLAIKTPPLTQSSVPPEVPC